MMLSKRPMRFFTSPFSYLAARMRKREACCGREQFPVRYNKAVRASSIRRRMELRRLVRSSAREPEGGLDWPPSINLNNPCKKSV